MVDVRSSPYSRYQPQFNREDISQALNREEIEYHYMGDMLGGRYSSPPDLLFPDGIVDYEKVSTTRRFASGLERVIKLIHDGRTVSLICSEKDPLTCHRFVLIGKNLQKLGIEVIHLYPELIKKTHAELENELLIQNGLKGQKTLMGGSETDSIELMYTRLNKKIGYKTVPNTIDDAGQTPANSDVKSLNSDSSSGTEEKPKKDNHQETLF
ncbi:DUF488 family protein [Methanogenium cariaci]|uniref:DUF488 domain-containing protein n=1 Tax=Methanogenium cariaci TaxID=2197 RepID=UPI0009F8BE64|nr:DUF488 domain-containing protein [Methanogenium cariaci]